MRSRTVFSIIYLVIMIGVVVGLDLAFWRHQTEWRLIGNIGTVAVFVAGYFIISRFIKR